MFPKQPISFNYTLLAIYLLIWKSEHPGFKEKVLPATPTFFFLFSCEVFKSLVNTEGIIIIKRVTSDQRAGEWWRGTKPQCNQHEWRLLHIHRGEEAGVPGWAREEASSAGLLGRGASCSAFGTYLMAQVLGRDPGPRGCWCCLHPPVPTCLADEAWVWDVFSQGSQKEGENTHTHLYLFGGKQGIIISCNHHKYY